jgi:iron complex outermembrane recepter protein
VRLNLKVRTIDSDVTYFTHYPDSYSNPSNPFLDANQRVMGRYSDASLADLQILSSDNNLLFTFGTGGFAEHRLLVGADYSWNRVTKQGGYGFDQIDVYAPTYASFDEPSLTDNRTRVSQRQVGFYLQDEVRLFDRASVVLGARRDRLRTLSLGSTDIERASATSVRAGVIAEVLPGLSPFASYTQSFAPVSGLASNGRPFVPTRGRQYEAGVKWHPADATLVTLTGYSIDESERPVDDPATPDPFDQRQAGRLFSSGVELEATHRLPGAFDVIASWSYNRARLAGERQQLGNVPKQIASLWTTKTWAIGGGDSLQVGAGLRYSGANESGTVRTPSATLVDALATWNRGPLSLSVNATNLLGRSFYAACLARGDCFIGAERNVFGTATLRF